jgi:predicted esterase
VIKTSSRLRCKRVKHFSSSRHKFRPQKGSPQLQVQSHFKSTSVRALLRPRVLCFALHKDVVHSSSLFKRQQSNFAKMTEKPPYILEPLDDSSGRPATFIFLHGYADEAEGLPLGLAQQFQLYKKMPYLKWLLPNAPRHQEAMTHAWYMPKALPNAMKPQVPGDAAEETEPDDEEGILKTCDMIDQMVEGELTKGTEPGRIVVGGFSQGCAISLAWGQVGKLRDKVGGIVCLSGYFPLSDRIGELRKVRSVQEDGPSNVQWFYIHGSADALIPMRLFVQGVEELSKYVDKENIEGHVYDGLGHSTNNALLRDLLGFLRKVLPP